MLTIFTIPKPFVGHIGVIQRNALASWTRLSPRCQVIVFGDEPGTGEVAAELGLERVQAVERNELGTPLLPSVFEGARARARFGMLCWVNADIVLDDSLTAAVLRVSLRRFVMVGERLDVDVDRPIDVARPGWRDALLAAARPHGPTGMDYFVLPADDCPRDMPPLAVGRPAWDNWFIYQARARGLPVIDATAAVTALHQNHGYGHVPAARGRAWEGPEADRNRALVGGRGEERLFTLEDVTHRLPAHGPLQPVRDLARWWLRLPALHPWSRPAHRVVSGAYRRARRLLPPR